MHELLVNSRIPASGFSSTKASNLLAGNRCRAWILLTLLLCLCPSIATSLGFDFNYSNNVATGLIVHALLEWSSVILAFATVILAMAHYSVKKDITTPVIGLALFFSGTMDAFHVLAATQLIDAEASNTNLVPFTWAMSRSFNAVILLLGIFLCLKAKLSYLDIHLKWLLVIAFAFGLAAYGLIYFAANSQDLPQTQFPEGFISRPFDVIPLLLFLLAIPLFIRLFRLLPNMITLSIALSLIPEICLELHMALGSSQLFDTHFNAAHQLKVLAYLVPFIGFSIDYMTSASDQNKLLAIVQEREARLSAIVDSSAEGIITINELGQINSFNRASEKMFGYTESEVLGKNLKMLMPMHYENEHDEYIAHHLRTGEKRIIDAGREVEALKKNGAVFPIHLAVSRIQVGEQIGFSGMIRDISESKAAEAKIAEMLENLLRSNQDLEKFAHVASHDLRSPLRGIDHICQWLEDDFDEQLSQDSKVLMTKLKGRVRRMESLLDDLLHYSQIRKPDADKVEMISAYELCLEVTETLHRRETQNIQLDASLKSVLIPRMPLHQVFINLLSNALKHNLEGPSNILVVAKVNQTNINFEFQDDGIGIDEIYHERIFEMFQTLRPRDEVEGSGMGLALVKKSLLQSNANIRIESSLGKGANFIVSWPLTDAIISDSNIHKR